MRTRILSFAFIFLICSLSAQAGSPPASWSKVPGVLLGYSSEEYGLYAYFETDHSKKYIGEFQDACSKKRRLWAIGIPNTVVCTKLDFRSDVIELQLSTKDKKKDVSHAVVFSLKPLLTFKSIVRELDPAESQSLMSMYKTASLKEAIQNAISIGSVQVLDIPKKSLSIYIIKWKRVEDELTSNDDYLVMNRIRDKFFSAGNFKGEIIGFVDVNRDGIPEVQRSMDCDGACEAITSIYRNTRDFVSIYNH